MTFPDSFTWGAATAAYQIEGAAAARYRPVIESRGAVLGEEGT